MIFWTKISELIYLWPLMLLSFLWVTNELILSLGMAVSFKASLTYFMEAKSEYFFTFYEGESEPT